MKVVMHAVVIIAVIAASRAQVQFDENHFNTFFASKMAPPSVYTGVKNPEAEVRLRETKKYRTPEDVGFLPISTEKTLGNECEGYPGIDIPVAGRNQLFCKVHAFGIHIGTDNDGLNPYLLLKVNFGTQEHLLEMNVPLYEVPSAYANSEDERDRWAKQHNIGIFGLDNPAMWNAVQVRMNLKWLDDIMSLGVQLNTASHPKVKGSFVTRPVVASHATARRVMLIAREAGL